MNVREFIQLLEALPPDTELWSIGPGTSNDFAIETIEDLPDSLKIVTPTDDRNHRLYFVYDHYLEGSVSLEDWLKRNTKEFQ